MDQQRTLEQLRAIHEVQTLYFEDGDPAQLFEKLLAEVLALSDSEYGFIGEVLRDPSGAPFLKTHAITNIAWNEESRRFFEENAPTGLEFRNLQTLFGAAMTKGDSVIANDPPNDPRRGGLPEGHPELASFLGVPLYAGGEMVGLLGVANRPGGYDEALVEWLDPLLTTIANMVRTHAADRERRRVAARLEESELRFRRLWDANLMGIIVADSDGAIVEANEAFLTSIGYGQEDLPLSWRELTPPELIAVDERAIEIAKEEGSAPPYEKTLIHRDGHAVPVLVGIAQLERSIGICFVMDLSAQQRLGVQVREAHKMQAVGRLAGSIAHDFNNLLTVVLGFAATWIDSERIDDPRHPASEILEAAKHARDLVSQLLAFSRGEQLERVRMDVNRSLRERESMLQRLLREEIVLRLDLGEDAPAIRAAPSEFEQIVLNLVANARDALSGGGHIEISTRRALAPGTGIPGLCLVFKDDGVGMEATTRERLFEPFFSTKAVERGSGLGLSTVYGIIQRIGGSIQVDSEPGTGTRVEIWLPEDHTVPEETPAAPPPRSGPGIARTVLLVEDEQAIRRLLSIGLRRAGHRVIEADDGEHALRIIGNEPVDIVVTDVVMPNMRGPQLLRRLRATRPGLPAILISGNADFFDRAGVTQSDRTALLQKPFRPADLLATMVELLDDPPPGQS